MKSTMTISQHDLFRIVLGYLTQKYNGQYKIKPNDLRFIIKTDNGNIEKSIDDLNAPCLSHLEITYDDRSNNT